VVFARRQIEMVRKVKKPETLQALSGLCADGGVAN